MPQSLLGLKQLKSGEIGSYITGALGISSTGSTVYASKPYVFNDTLVASGDVDFQNDFAAQENVKIKSGLIVSGDITGVGGLVVSGIARFENSASFDDPVIFETGVIVSGEFTTHGANTFNNSVTFGSTVSFNNAVNLQNITVNGTSTFNATTNLIGTVNNIGAGGGSPSTSYYLGTHRFSGDSFFTGNTTFRGINTFSGNTNFNSGVTFNSGNIIFSGTGQSFATKTFFSGDARFYGNLTGASVEVLNSLEVSAGGSFTSDSPAYFNSNAYVSGNSSALVVRGGAAVSLLDADIGQISGLYSFDESTFNLNSGSIFSIKSGSKLNIQSGFTVQNYGSVPSTSVVPGGQLYLQKLDINGVTYYVLAMRQWT